MPEELDVSDRDEEIMDEVWEEIEEEAGLTDTSLSTDAHGREHAPAGTPEGGQFVSRRRKRVVEITVQSGTGTPTAKQPEEAPPKLNEPLTEPSPEVKGTGYVHLREHREAAKKAIEKLKMCPLPTEGEVQAAKEGVKKKGANLYRKDLIGNTKNRRDRRNKLLVEFGDGKTCPCIYCGEVITHGTMEQDKIYTTLEGGRYRIPNLVPSCEACNKKRRDMPFAEAMKRVVSYVRHRAETGDVAGTT